MRKKWMTAAGVTVLAFLFVIALGFLEYKEKETSGKLEKTVWHHEISKAADPTVGSDTIPGDFLVDESFTSHLPLIVIDTQGQEIMNYKYYDAETDSFRYREGADPYSQIKIDVFDNEALKNTLSDTPSFSGNGKIKIRGNSSASLDKKQYRLQLQDSEGEKMKAPLLGMDPASEWILNGAQRDPTYMRNYLAYNLAHNLDSFSPEVRYCEVLKKAGDKYLYEGLYLLIEPIEQGPGRVDIAGYSPDRQQTSYIVRRDREDPDEQALLTYTAKTDISEIWSEEAGAPLQLGVVYPKAQKMTEASFQYIENDLSQIEEILYSSDPLVFLQYGDHIDVQSFIDYFLLCEFTMNYDSGIYSTYMYKELGGKLKMGPYWDFDVGMDNNSRALTDFHHIVMRYRPYFDRLCRDEAFLNQMNKRYRQLRDGILSDAYIQDALKETEHFLGKAIMRDRQRWKSSEPKLQKQVLTESETKLEVDRNRSGYEAEVRRMKDALMLHGEYMDKHLYSELSPQVNHAPVQFSFGGWLFIIAFFVSVILVQRYRKGA